MRSAVRIVKPAFRLNSKVASCSSSITFVRNIQAPAHFLKDTIPVPPGGVRSILPHFQIVANIMRSIWPIRGETRAFSSSASGKANPKPNDPARRPARNFIANYLRPTFYEGKVL
jgi:hypothetical protein